jgi:hypothetical protein
MTVPANDAEHSDGRLLTDATASPLAQQVDMPQVSSSLLDQVQQNPAQREAALRRAHVQRDACRHNRVAALSLSGIVGQQIGHGEVLGHVQLTVGVALAPVEDQTILTGEDVAHPRTLHIGQVAYHSVQR